MELHDAVFALLAHTPVRSATRDSAAVTAFETERGVRMPPAVRDWYERSDALAILRDFSNADTPLPPSKMSIDGDDDRKLVVFMIENQGVCRWAFALDQDDPEVYVAFERGPWQSCDCTFSKFVWCTVFDWDSAWSEDARTLAGDPPDDSTLELLRRWFREEPSNRPWGRDHLMRRFSSERVRITIREGWIDDGETEWSVSTRTFADMDELLVQLSPFYDEER